MENHCGAGPVGKETKGASDVYLRDLDRIRLIPAYLRRAVRLLTVESRTDKVGGR